MSPPQRVLTAAASTVKSRRIRSARAVAAGSGIVVRLRRRGVRPQRHVSCQEQPQRQSGCVEIALTDDRIVVRDAKDRAGPVLVFTPTERDAFLDGIRDGEFDPASARRRRSPPGPRRCAAPREPPPRRSPRTVLATYPRGRQDPTVLWPRLRGGSRCPIPHRSELRSLQRFGQPKPSVPTDRARF
jgi:hypothetical protein